MTRSLAALVLSFVFLVPAVAENPNLPWTGKLVMLREDSLALTVPEVGGEVYRELCTRAAAALRAGYAAVIDAVALRAEERHSFAAVAAAAGVPFTGLWLEAPAETMRSRIAGRRRDASDASSEILSHQLAHNPSALDWIGIDAGGEPEATLAAARRAMVH